MKRKIFYGLGAILIGALALGAVANGPYYAWPSWSQKLACAVGNCPRFIELSDWNGAAVLDRETGLVWGKSPITFLASWLNAQPACIDLNTGGRLGWRLPTIQELASLVDRSVNSPGPTLPAGHPFQNVQSHKYWSATTRANNDSNAWSVNFSDGSFVVDAKSTLFGCWCVRGGQGVDPQ